MPRIECTCKRVLSFRSDQGGKVVKCPACSATIRLPVVQQPPFAKPSEPGSLDDLVEARLSQKAKPRGPSEATAAPEEDLKLEVRPPPPPLPPPRERAPPKPAYVSPYPSPRLPAHFQTFWASVPGAFSFPLRGEGLVALIVGLVFFVGARYLLFMLAFFPLIGWILALALYVVMTGYLAGYLMTIM